MLAAPRRRSSEKGCFVSSMKKVSLPGQTIRPSPTLRKVMKQLQRRRVRADAKRGLARDDPEFQVEVDLGALRQGFSQDDLLAADVRIDTGRLLSSYCADIKLRAEHV